MNYEVIKSDVSLANSSIIEEYKELLRKVNEVYLYTQRALQNESVSVAKRMDYYKYLSNDPDVREVLRLKAALEYVKNPQLHDEELQHNILINKSYRRK